MQIPVIIGATAAGKTAFAIEKALNENGEIISADSRQIYKEMNIGTAKPSARELATVPHHFIDELPLDVPFSAGQFAKEALLRIEDILAREKKPIICGGSTLYLQALTKGIAPVPDIPISFRATLQERLAAEGAEKLYQELQQIDPVFAQTLDATKTQRLVRGLEVWYATHKKLSEWHKEQVPPPYTFSYFYIQLDRALLYERINQRVDIMLGNGLLKEVQTILATGYSPTLNPLKTIGYQEPIAYLKGEIEEAEMVKRLKQNTRHYAKRQITWFNKFAT